MRWTALLLCSALVACSAQSASLNDTVSDEESPKIEAGLAKANESPTPRASDHKEAQFFVVDNSRDPEALRYVRQNTGKEIIAGHYSSASVPCGTGCVSEYLVDRKTGGVIALPATDDMDDGAEMFWTVEGADDDSITITYGPSTGIEGDRPCRQATYRVRGTEITQITELRPLASCPD